ncbi:hypothetical protein EYF80_046877 [Liparis tanakae]|uniref:Uncharacterized protein n=1 Tax=Liparis tanakae TaxID=230148 RepID=A0A4Z2FP72_9TELE|nr:hypothetical protein EYF80_046877 [Liparis tanakae]
MEMIVEDQNQPGTQIQIDLQILMKSLETLLNQILMRTLLNQILMTLLIGRRPENLNRRGIWIHLVQTGDPDLLLRKNLFFNHQQLLDVCGKYPEDSSTASWTCCFTNSLSFSPGDTETDTGGSSDSIFERRMRSWMLCMMGKRFAVVTES